MNARITGCGEVTLVLAYGLGGTQEVWDKLILQLTPRYRVLTFDWNFSSSIDQRNAVPFDTVKYSTLKAYADDLITLLDDMNMEGVVYIGNSMAGMIGCIASVIRPDIFTHLVLIGASPRYLNSDDYHGGFEQAEVESILSNIESNFQAWAENLVKHAMGPNGDPLATARFMRGFQKMNQEIALCLAKTIFLGDYRAVLENVEVPCTIIQGTNDFVVPVSVAYYMQSKMKASTTVEIFDSEGHFPQLTTPERVVDVIDRILMQKKY